MIKLESSEFDLLRLLSFVFVVRAYIYMQVAEHFTSQRILREHAAYCIFHQSKWLALQLLLGSACALTSGVARVTDVLLLVPLVSSQNDLLCIDHNYVVTTVCVWSEIRLVLSAQALRNFGCQTAQSLALSIDEQPLLICVLLVDGDGFVAQSIHSSVF